MATLRSVAQVFQHPVGGTAHVQDHRQAVFARQLQLFPVKVFLTLAQGARTHLRHKEIQANFANCHQLRVIAMQVQLCVQLGQVSVLGSFHAQRVNAQRIAVASVVRQTAHRVKIGHPDCWQDAISYFLYSCLCTDDKGFRAKLWCIQVAMGIYPGGHAGEFHRAFSALDRQSWRFSIAFLPLGPLEMATLKLYSGSLRTSTPARAMIK